MKLEVKEGYHRHHILPCLKYYSKEYGNDIYAEFDEEDCIYLTVSEHQKLHQKINPRPHEMYVHIGELNRGRVPWNKGLPCSEEQKMSISKTLTGRKQSEETIKKRAKSLTGLKRDNKAKANMSNFQRGKGRHYVCVETGVVIEDYHQLREYTHNEKATLAGCINSVKTGGIAYGYHWKVKENEVA